MKRLPIFAIVCCVFLLRGQATLAQSETYALYQRVTLVTEIDPSLYTNPFDAGDIELIGVFDAPSGRQLVIPGFWMQPYVDECQQPCRAEDLQPSGDPSWQVRFTPDEVGQWSYSLQVRDDGTTIRVERGAFTVSASEHPGFISVSGNNRYFQYANGQSYFPIGHNLLSSWPAGGGLVTYRRWLEDLSAAGGNYARLLIDDPWFIGLEWKSAAGDYRASQDDAARLDAILDMAAEYGISLQLVLLWHQALITYSGVPVVIPTNPPRPDTSADWHNSGYNVINGGPLSGPALFFSDERARALFQQRLRYIAARWGYSPQIFAWELVDEIDRTTNYDATTAGDWLQSMASYLRQADQGRHLITAGSRSFDATIAAAPALSFTQARFFQRRPFETVADQVLGAVDSLRQSLDVVRAPALLTEFALNPWFEPTLDDPDGVSVQTTIWAAAFSGAGGAAMSAYGDTYVEPLNLQRYYPPLAAFAAAVDWAHLNLAPAEAALLSDDATLYQPLRIDAFASATGQAPPAAVHTISGDGVQPDVSETPRRLYGQLYNQRWSGAQHYHLAVPHDTTFEARVRGTSTQAGARLVVSVDGNIAAELVLSAGAKDVALRVPLSVGEHDITLENQGDDWLDLDYLEIGQLVTPVRLLTLRDTQAGVALAWLQNRDYTWDRLAVAREPLLFTYRVEQMPRGRYSVEIWDPLTGGVVGSELVRVGADGVLSVELVPLTAELALRITRQVETLPPTPTPLALATNTPAPTLAEPLTPTQTPALAAADTLTEEPSALPSAVVTEAAAPAATETPMAATDEPAVTETPTLTQP